MARPRLRRRSAAALFVVAALLGNASAGLAAERVSELGLHAPSVAARDGAWSARCAELRERVASLRTESRALSFELKELKAQARSPSARDKPLRAIVSSRGKLLRRIVTMINKSLAELRTHDPTNSGKVRSARLSSIEARIGVIDAKLATLKRSRSVGAALDVALVIDAEANAANEAAAKL